METYQSVYQLLQILSLLHTTLLAISNYNLHSRIAINHPFESTIHF